MENTIHDRNGNTEFNLPSKQLELLYQQFATRFRTEEAENKEDVLTVIPAAILSDLEETTTYAMEKKLKCYVRDLPHYEDNESKSIDAEVRNLATKALRLPQSLKYLEEQSEENKRLAFSQGTVEKISQVRFEAAVIQRATNI
ncbi:hypothetical protein CU097_004371 [Rhizopus azygosporus]|uniref:Uncharacterized protein n=1 Tax=Rhizopus azygosporus TaxID=86630 RepID=A0A367ISK5_RHIAZ|nr:hypothetical protein CU097_004371 [Rhizopus azygosporus]